MMHYPLTVPDKQATSAIDLRTICPAYVSPAELRKHREPGTTPQVTARPIKGGKWEGIFRDVDGTGAESANHPTAADAVKAAAFYANRAA